jgi:hypothetical protein
MKIITISPSHALPQKPFSSSTKEEMFKTAKDTTLGTEDSSPHPS